MATWTVMAPGCIIAEKGGVKPLLFLRIQTCVSADPFCEILTYVAVMMAIRRPSWCIAVWSWSFVLILCYFDYLDVRERLVCVRARSCVRFRAFLYSTIRIKQDIKILRTNP